MGYTLDGDFYESFCIDDTASKKKYNVFAKQICSGKVSLYYAIFDQGVGQYFFKKLGEKFYHVYANEEILELGNAPYLYKMFNKESVFLDYFSLYFSDCLLVSRMLKNSYYTIDNFEKIFLAYNKCEN